MAQERTLIEDPKLMALLDNMKQGDSGVPAEEQDGGTAHARQNKFEEAQTVQGHLAHLARDPEVSRISLNPTSMVVEVRCLPRAYDRMKKEALRLLKKNEVTQPQTKFAIKKVRKLMIAKPLHGAGTIIDMQNDGGVNQNTVAAIACDRKENPDSKSYAEPSQLYALSVGPSTDSQDAFVITTNVMCRLTDPGSQPGNFDSRFVSHTWQPGGLMEDRFDLAMVDVRGEPVHAHYHHGNVNISEVKDPLAPGTPEGLLLPEEGTSVMLLSSRGSGSASVRELNALTADVNGHLYRTRYVLTLNPGGGTLASLQPGDCGTSVVIPHEGAYYLIGIVHAVMVPREEPAEEQPEEHVNNEDEDPGIELNDDDDDDDVEEEVEPHVLAFLLTEPFQQLEAHIGTNLRLLPAPAAALEVFAQ